jgi:hypothetical protein
MATLSLQQQRRLACYITIMDAKPADQRRDGFDVPGTHQGRVYDYACWNWAFTGGRITVRDPGSAVTIWEDIITMNILVEPPAPPAAINAVDAHYPGSGAEFTALRNNWTNACNGNAAAEDAVKDAMLRIGARKNGLSPVGGPPGAGTIYTIHMKTGDDEWYGWHHLGIGIKLMYRGLLRQTVVQTITEVPLSHCCSEMWDEDLPDTVIGVQELLGEHVSYLDNVQYKCCACNADPPGGFRSLQGWHQCGHCFAAYCRACKANLVVLRAKTTFNPHTLRQCDRPGCPGQTQVI